jgi:hypothetical protein
VSSTGLPLSSVLAWWGTALLRGLAGPDELADALPEDHVAQVVLGPDGGLPGWLAGLRRDGAAGVAAVLPAAGDPTGLAGPPAFNAAAIDAGEAVVGIGGRTEPSPALVPTVVGRAVEWTPHLARRRPPPDVGEADRRLRGALLAAADDLARLDVARWRPEVADALHDLRAGAPLTAPPGVPERCADLARRALHLWVVADLALADDGAAVSASEITARRDAVVPLERAARQALAAACSPDGWPPA